MSSRSAPEIEHRYANPSSYHGDLPPDWDSRRKATYQRDNWTCQHCGTQSGPHVRGDGVRLHAHHVEPRADGGSNDLGNLVTLCEECHQAAHDHDIFGDGWEGDQSPTSIFGATSKGWAIGALTSLSGFYFGYMMSNFAGLFDGFSGGSFVGVLAGLYLALLVVTIWKPLLAIGGYGLLGAIFVAYISDTGQAFTAPEPLFHLVITWGAVVLLGGALVFGHLQR